jgi:hypothetical protein
MFLFVMDLIDICVFKGKSEIKQIFIQICQKLMPKLTYAYFSPQISEEDDATFTPTGRNSNYSNTSESESEFDLV